MSEKVQRLGTDPSDAQLREIIALNGEFHRALIQASENVLVQQILDMLQTPFAHRFYHWRDPVRQREVLHEHEEIVAAMRTGNSATVKTLLERHVLDSRDYLLDHLKESIK